MSLEAASENGLAIVRNEIIPGTIQVERGLVGERVLLDDGKEMILFIAKPGQFAGEGIMDPDAELVKLTEDVAMSDVTLNSSDLLFAQHQRTAQANGFRMQEYAADRLAYGLFTLSGNGEANNSARVLIPLTQQVLGNWVGVSREVVNNKLRRFQQRGILASRDPLIIAKEQRATLGRIMRRPLPVVQG